MQKNYNVLLERLNSRMNPDKIIVNKSFSSEIGSIPQREIFLYIKKTMLGVEPEYTQKSKEAGQKVREKLVRELNDVSFEYQGSVMTNTHIRGYSDIDLLTICEKFYTFDRNGINATLNDIQKIIQLDRLQIGRLQTAAGGGGYTQGLSDLRSLRIDSERILNSNYLHVDDSKPKSIKVSLTNPKREVDVVLANWYKNANYFIQDDKTMLGIKVFVKGDTPGQDKELAPDYPFLSIARINGKDSEVNGRLKKMIRFLKTLKYDSDYTDNIKLSSFDFNAICYEIDASKYRDKDYLDLVTVVYNQLNSLANNPNHRNSLMSVDGYEPIFRNPDGSENTEKVQSLKLVMAEINSVIADIVEEKLTMRLQV